MINYPQFDPVALNLGPLKIHWYGLMYLAGFLVAYYLAQWRRVHHQLSWGKEEISDLIFILAMGVICGGRIGYMIFYNLHSLLSNPLSLFEVWKGGMSFHGGFLGVIFAIFYIAWKKHRSFWMVADFVAPLVPLGLAFGRLGNFINGELWGRVSDLPWAMVFPYADEWPRHPSQIYEMLLEGFFLFALVWCYSDKKRPPGCVSAIFLIGYAMARLIAECFREPDEQIGFVAFNCITMGQLLSIPMLIFGFILWWSKRDANLLKTS